MQTQQVPMYAWFDPDDTTRQNARSKLAVIVIGLARTGMLGRERLRDAAILMMEPYLG